MGKKVIAIGVSLVLVSLIAFGEASYGEGNVAFAAPPGKQADPRASKQLVKKTDSSRDRAYRLCLLLHKGHLIRVNDNTLPAYLKNSDETISGSCQPEQTTVQ